MNCIKDQKDKTPKDESLGSEGVQYATGEEKRRIANSPRMNEVTDPSRYDPQLLVCLMKTVKFDLHRTVLHRNLEC